VQRRLQLNRLFAPQNNKDNTLNGCLENNNKHLAIFSKLINLTWFSKTFNKIQSLRHPQI